jgi:hypothetical protein
MKLLSERLLFLDHDRAGQDRAAIDGQLAASLFEQMNRKETRVSQDGETAAV